MKTNITRIIGKNRGKARIWIEGPALAGEGWTKGTPFMQTNKMGVIVFRRDVSHGIGRIRKVAGDAGRPIIDTNTDAILDFLGAEIGDIVNISIDQHQITITRAAQAQAHHKIGDVVTIYEDLLTEQIEEGPAKLVILVNRNEETKLETWRVNFVGDERGINYFRTIKSKA